MKQLLTIDEACKLLTLSKPTIYRMTCLKKIPHIKLGQRVMFDEDQLEEWLEKYKVAI